MATTPRPKPDVRVSRTGRVRVRWDDVTITVALTSPKATPPDTPATVAAKAKAARRIADMLHDHLTAPPAEGD